MSIQQIKYLRRTNRTFTLLKSINFVTNILAHKKPINNLLILEYIKFLNQHHLPVYQEIVLDQLYLDKTPIDASYIPF